MVYVDGFVIPLKKSQLKAYRKLAAEGGRIWMRHGALEYRECVAEDLAVTDPATGKRTSPFVRMAKLKRGDTLVFSWVVYRSKAHRKMVNAKVMKEMEKMGSWEEMPFDMSRMAYGGFKTIVDHR